MDCEVLHGGEREVHFGLRGMRERAELIGGKLVVLSAENAGTEVELTVPAPVAYADEALADATSRVPEKLHDRP